MSIPAKVERLRQQSKRALPLARAISDQPAAEALMLHAAKLLEEAERLEQQNILAP
jgi:hypothetical protein